MPDFSCLVDGCDKPSRTRRKQGYCQTHRARVYKHGDVGTAELKRKPLAGSLCTVGGCGKPRSARLYCSMHAARIARHGDVDALRPNAAGRFVQSGPGYIKLTGMTGHPLATGNGAVFEHRAVLYAAIGAGPQLCNWCSTEIHWQPIDDQQRLEVDHVDADRQNNALSNLVPSCQACNKSRRVHYKLARTHCSNGHEYTPDNLVPGLPHRKCLTCRREAVRRHDAKKRAAARR